MEEPRKVTVIESTSKKEVRGTTTINHYVRVSMKLSLEEYVLLDFIFNHNQARKEIITFGHYYSATGFIRQDIIILFSKLKERGLMVWNNEQKRVPRG